VEGEQDLIKFLWLKKSIKERFMGWYENTTDILLPKLVAATFSNWLVSDLLNSNLALIRSSS
jgi:hypothetical protein